MKSGSVPWDSRRPPYHITQPAHPSLHVVRVSRESAAPPLTMPPLGESQLSSAFAAREPSTPAQEPQRAQARQSLGAGCGGAAGLLLLSHALGMQSERTWPSPLVTYSPLDAGLDTGVCGPYPAHDSQVPLRVLSLGDRSLVRHRPWWPVAGAPPGRVLPMERRRHPAHLRTVKTGLCGLPVWRLSPWSTPPRASVREARPAGSRHVQGAALGEGPQHVLLGRGVSCRGDHGGGVQWPWQWSSWAVPVTMTPGP
jgi:hypothetical protein